MYKDENINDFNKNKSVSEIIEKINNNDLDAFKKRISEDNIIDIYDFLSISFMSDSNNVIKLFNVNLSKENNRFLNEESLDEVLDYYKNQRNISKFSLIIYSEYEGSYTLSIRRHYGAMGKNIDSFDEEINKVKGVISSFKQNFSGEIKKRK